MREKTSHQARVSVPELIEDQSDIVTRKLELLDLETPVLSRETNIG